MFFPTFCLGATFPLVGKIYTRTLSTTGKSIGFAYAINAIGAVLGSKNIKAVAVRGTGTIPVADAKLLLREGKKAYQGVRDKPGFLGWTPEGTAGITDWVNRVGALPTKNFRESSWDKHGKINGAAILKELKITDKGCYCCPTPCGKYGKAKTGLRASRYL